MPPRPAGRAAMTSALRAASSARYPGSCRAASNGLRQIADLRAKRGGVKLVRRCASRRTSPASAFTAPIGTRAGVDFPTSCCYRSRPGHRPFLLKRTDLRWDAAALASGAGRATGSRPETEAVRKSSADP